MASTEQDLRIISAPPTRALRVTVEREAFLTALREASKVITRSGLPILTCVRLTSTGFGGLRIEATDLELWYGRTVPTTTLADPASCAVQAKALRDVVTKAPKKARLTLDEDPVTGRLSITVDGSTRAVSIATSPVDDYPAAPPTIDTPRPWALTTDAKLFAAELAAIAEPASADEGRPVLTGVLFEREGYSVRMTSTDSYRLGTIVSRLRVPDSEDGPASILIPGRAVKLFAAFHGRSDSAILVNATETYGKLSNLDGVSVTARLIEGRYPDYKQLVPGPGAVRGTVVVDVATATQAVVALATLIQPSVPVRLELNGSVRFVAGNQSDGEASETLNELAGYYDGAEMTIGFNPRFLAAGLRFVGAERVAIRVIDPGKPAIIETIAADEERRYLIMPVRLWS